MWLVGALIYAAHAALAFERFYDWSHARAIEETARATREATGVDSGAGLWLNYLFGVVWLVDAVHGVATGEDGRRRVPRPARIAIEGFLAFLVFQGTVVFGNGPV